MGHAGEVTSLSFSPDGQKLATGSADRTIRIWMVNPQSLADMVCGEVRRNLTLDEWDRFVGEDIPYQQTCPELPPGAGKATGTVGLPERAPAPTMLFPADHAVFHHYPRTLTLRWAAAPGAAGYGVEVRFEQAIWVLAPHVPGTSYTLQFVGAQPGRWRVWSVGVDGRESARSDWRVFEFTR